MAAGATTLAMAAKAGAQGATKRRMQVPPLTCDVHVHIIGPPDKYPFIPDRAYTPPQASVADLRAMRAVAGNQRNVLVQPSFYGTDNRCMLDALGELGASARGVAVVADDISDAALADMEKRGVRGVRLNLATTGFSNLKAVQEEIGVLARRLKPLNWHIQIYTSLDNVVALAPVIEASPVPIVLDHFAMAIAAKGPNQPGLDVLTRLVKGKAWVKLSAPYRISDHPPGYAEVTPIARALIAANPAHMLWGSDWPHTTRAPGKGPLDIHPFLVQDEAATLDLMADWAPEAKTRQAILVDNPARLYRF